MRKKTVHIISHSHWDREWYMPFEKHRLKLIDLIDDCLELFEHSEGFKSFHLDGQCIVLDDYLEIKPEMKDLITKNIKEGKFHIGPWYILQDEFLTSGESNVRNLLVGIEEAKEYGGLARIGYFPDAFGNAGQMPQLLKQAGMEAVVFGRGVKPVGFNNSVEKTGDYESLYSEMQWNSPDGSGLLGVLFANWYNNGAEIPVEEEEAKVFWDNRLEDVIRYASTEHLLFMNGCDHQPVQKDLERAIATANRLYPDYEFVHSDFEHYVQCIKEAQDNNLSVVTGELTSQMTDGWTTLVNTTSSRNYIKQLNRENEVLLQNLSEPLAVFAAQSGKAYPHGVLKYAWKTLMQNHPHDSICGCSLDEVHREMEGRYHKSMQVAEELIKESMRYVGSDINTIALEGQEAYPFTVFNTTGWSRNSVISVILDIERKYDQSLNEAYDDMKALKIKQFVLVDNNGIEIPCRIEDAGVRFGYDLPEDKFRQPYMARSVKVSFEACEVPAMGYKVYTLVSKKTPVIQRETLVIPNGMENEYLKVTLNEDGTIDLLDKSSGKSYGHICYYEDTGDIGNEYIYRQPDGDKAIVSKDYSCTVELIEDEPYRAGYKVTQIINIPEAAAETLQEEIQSMTDVKIRRAQRNSRIVPLEITTYLSLEKHGRGVKVRTEFDNRMKDHRLRVIIPTGIEADYHFADSVFEIVDRPNKHYQGWTNPSGCEHQQCFAGIKDEKAGILAANYGLYEYEILPEQNNAIALTLLRAVGELGDWGVFLTPDAQVQRKCSVLFEIIPFDATDIESDPAAEAYQFQVPMLTSQISIQEGSLPLQYSYLEWEGKGIYLTGLKRMNGGDDTIIRWFNGSGRDSHLMLRTSKKFKYYKSNVVEEHLEELTVEEEIIKLKVRPYEIVTIGMEEI